MKAHQSINTQVAELYNLIIGSRVLGTRREVLCNKSSVVVARQVIAVLLWGVPFYGAIPSRLVMQNHEIF